MGVIVWLLIVDFLRGLHSDSDLPQVVVLASSLIKVDYCPEMCLYYRFHRALMLFCSGTFPNLLVSVLCNVHLGVRHVSFQS